MKSLFVLFCVLLPCLPLFSQSLLLNRFDIQQEFNAVERDSHYMAFTSAIRYKDGDKYLQLLPIYTHVSSNSSYADGFNDGHHWQGKGFNQSFSGGIQGRWKAVEYTFAPILSYSQNLAYDYRSGERGRPPYQYVFTDRIDYVMRYGDEAKFDFFLGQTEVAYNWKKLRLSLGSNNMWWGSGVYQSGLMSNHAPGFPHFRLGNREPWRGKHGSFSFQWVSGYLRESDFLNTNSSDNYRAFDGILLNLKPDFFPGLTLNFSRIMQFYSRNVSLRDSWKLFQDFFKTTQFNGGESSNVESDQMISFGFDWRSELELFRIYFQWVRGDFSIDQENFTELKDLLVQPDHNSGIILGFIKTFLLSSNRKLHMNYEYANLSTWQTANTSPDTRLNQGYTHLGQIMGASIGPGSRFDALGLTYETRKTSIMFEYLRTRYNDDVFYSELSQEVDYQDTQHFLALSARKMWDKLEVQGSIGVGLRSDFNYIPGNYRQNVQPQLILRYHL